jgi:hypothetical protein
MSLSRVFLALCLLTLATPALAHDDDTPPPAGPMRPAWGPWVLLLHGTYWMGGYDGWFQSEADCKAAGKQAAQNETGYSRLNFTCFKVPEGE